MKKFLSIVLGALLCVGVLVGCGQAASSSQSGSAAEQSGQETDSSAQKPKMSWVGSYHTSNAMGDVVSGHLLNFYSDGSVKIYYGIKAGMQGHHYGVYEGTYTEDGAVKYTYFKESDNAELEGEFQADFTKDSFQAKIFCKANFPNSSGGGINYVRIPPIEPDQSAEYTYIGSKVDENGAYAALMQLKGDTLTGAASANGVMGEFDGSYEIVYSDVTDIDTQDQLVLHYPPLVVEADSIRSEGKAAEVSVDFNDSSYLSTTLLAAEDVFPKIPMAAIINQDGNKAK